MGRTDVKALIQVRGRQFSQLNIDHFIIGSTIYYLLLLFTDVQEEEEEEEEIGTIT